MCVYIHTYTHTHIYLIVILLTLESQTQSKLVSLSHLSGPHAGLGDNGSQGSPGGIGLSSEVSLSRPMFMAASPAQNTLDSFQSPSICANLSGTHNSP